MTGKDYINNIWKTMVFISFVVLISIVNYYHEAWYDEAQAWMIAKESSIYELIFVIPHSEGHPPLWSLILYPLARSGLGYEVCMKSLMVVISSINAALILWKSPFPALVKALLPYSYFVFYQYGVIARPYGLMIMAMLLVAITYHYKDEKPWHHVLSLIYLCLTSAYGIVIAGSIAIVWVIEIWNRQNIKEWVKSFIKDKRFLPLLVLLITGLLLIYMIIPDKGVYVGSASADNNFFVRLLMCLITIPVETTCTQSFEKYVSLKKMQFSMTSFIIEIFLGILLWVVLIYIGKKAKKLMLLLVPYITLSLFASSVYFFIHHTGIMMIYIMSWCFIVCKEIGLEETGYMEYLGEKLKSVPLIRKFIDKEIKLIKGCTVAALAATLVISAGWSASASYNEVRYQYSYAKELSEFFREHNMYELNILAERPDYTTKDGGKAANTYNLQNIIPILPYISDNEAEAFIQCRDVPKYVLQKRATDYENEMNYKKWAEEGKPDVLIGDCELELIYGDEVSFWDYEPVKCIPFGYEWKNLRFPQCAVIYMRKDLIEKYGLHKLSNAELSAGSGGLAQQRVDVR